MREDFHDIACGFLDSVHFWAPTFKWGISIANVADFSKPPEKISYPQQIAVTCTGLIWSRYSMVITPVVLSQPGFPGLKHGNSLFACMEKLESFQCKCCNGWDRPLSTFS
ncbi:uncharacterized protein [Elaeis guineensis]|uniref:uncharacterized protein isoform X2 n=1 Tax=Elaeis guineensis var. tenera TaxID=51953 RepID=UPI003C6D0AE6